MSTARDILDQRLAKGEITPEQHAELLAKLGPQPGTTKPTPPPTKAAPAKSGGYAGWVGAGLVGLVLLIGYGNIKGGRTQILNLRSAGWSGQIISGTLVTEGKSGKVWTWIEQGGRKMCPRTTFMRQGVPQRFEYTCYQLGSGNFTMKTNRFPDDWVKANATSL